MRPGAEAPLDEWEDAFAALRERWRLPRHVDLDHWDTPLRLDLQHAAHRGIPRGPCRTRRAAPRRGRAPGGGVVRPAPHSRPGKFVIGWSS
ncbi:lantibiotic dehydratase [Streptomyces canus]|uniref:lantibiotic dehydratase n=1 Tax=Streptomyces canus TaxID=58343 RepID=UPI0039A63380